MRKFLNGVVLLIAVLSFASCNKPYQTELDLAVSQEKINLSSSLGGHCYITVFSNTSWNIELQPAVDWARLDVSGGSGIAYVRFDYDDNLGSEPRSVDVVVSGSGKTCRIVVTQNAD